MIKTFHGITPDTEKAAFIAETAAVAGDVVLGEGSSVWYGAALRGDVSYIRIGRGTNIQDNATVHVDRGMPALVGDWVTVGHNAVIHGCRIGDGSLIGMGAVVLSGAVIGEGSLVGAGALVTGHMHFPPRSLILGSPARLERELLPEEVEKIRKNAVHYMEEAAEYAAGED